MMNEHCQFPKLVTLDEAHALCLTQQFRGIVELYETPLMYSNEITRNNDDDK